MPEKIGRYEVSEELGKGAMGVVYKAVDPNIGRPIALKTMRVDVHGSEAEDMLKRFQNEARAAGLLNHPNIVTIYDAGEDQGVFYIAMEYIPGKTLAKLLQEVRVVSAEQLVSIGTQICAGLDFAHSKGVIHRDIKPPNIMILPDGTVKIMDFGIAKAGASLTHTGEVLGTPNYMSPEQVKGKDLDGRTDLFSTGVILYEMATGERPFHGQNVTTIIYKIINETPAAPRELDVTIHPGLSAIISKCLAKDPEERYQSGSDLATALKSYKIVSLPDPRATAGPRISPSASATGISTRPLQAVQPTVLRTAAPAAAVPQAAAAAAKPAPAPAPAADETAPTEVLKPKAPAAPTPSVPARASTAPGAKKPFPAAPVAIAVVLLAIIIGAVAIKRKSPALTSNTQSRTVASAPVPSSTSDAPAKPPSPVPGIIGNATQKPSAAKPVAAAGIGDLRITSNPPGAQVEIDGVAQDWYVTPFNAPPMKSGTHTIRVQMNGLTPQTRNVEVIAGEKVSVDFQLAGERAIYGINSTPAGAEVMIDGVPSGRTTPAEMLLTPGQHKVVLRLEGFAPEEITTDAAAGQTMNISPVLRARNSVLVGQQELPEQQGLGNVGKMGAMRRFYQQGEIPAGMGALQFRTRPKGATITVDDRTLQRVTPFKVPLPPGGHRITFRKDGFQTVTRTVQVEQGQQVEIDEILPPQR